MRMLHFGNNANRNQGDRLYKLAELFEMIRTKFKESYTPTEEICIDESR